ncbi:uncharacterized protein LOC119835737 [Zerene cesonia]|uniref:uncharacterized protein LOC119835737 n=1 Tax=Zerene cesonia TaxID=33412 RepID=UPI0018E4F495|nr:uncharacterized protein LOC119835737 [Zerene cesonia]
MDSRTVLLFCLAMFLAILATAAAGRTKKVVIHVPYKVKKIKHTHTVYKTIHHHHKHHDLYDHGLALPTEEHEHFHHVLLDEPTGHAQPLPSMGFPEYLPDVPMDETELSEYEDLPIPTRHVFYKREK